MTKTFLSYKALQAKTEKVYFHNLSANRFLAGEDLYTSTTDSTSVSGYIQNGAGHGFRYVLAGASSLVVGNVLQSPAIDTQFTNMAVPAAVATGTAAGTGITITNGTTVLTGSEFVGGSLSVYTTPGLGEEYTITGNGAAASGAALTVYLDRPIRTAWTTATKVNMRFNPFMGVIQAPATTLTGTVVGVAIYPITNAQYGWIQSRGTAAALSDGSSILVGSDIVGLSGTAGAVALATAGVARIGYAMQAGAAAHCIAVRLQID